LTKRKNERITMMTKRTWNNEKIRTGIKKRVPGMRE